MGASRERDLLAVVIIFDFGSIRNYFSVRFSVFFRSVPTGNEN